MLPQFRFLCVRFMRRKACGCAALNSVSVNASYSTVNKEEVNKFTKNASTFWWNDNQSLISMNSVRVPFIRDGLLLMSKYSHNYTHPLKGFKIIDVGCGGGILSEPLARLGASVTGLDPGAENIEVAVAHASMNEDVKDNVTYICDSIENIRESHAGMFDAVVCSEVIEHVADVKTFLECCVDITKEGGSLFFTTPNRTIASYFTNIVLGEYVLQVLPPGTHDWNKFITSSELSDMLLSLDCRIVSSEGFMYNPVTKRFSWSDFSMLYALHACK
ncbi:ubiquinone biosynthesis O-methyltransferase, mitochondrial [Parasteatoda tepidariorum]|uniref:ubiquinone biosynthesis O-methyltransferase, mitochondrial n=1 Tax=Parasteatoda tepidariorum TaxID=114398 RepID=UPI001C721798|nr:ubiquinone biosynthesis O-methyltransferase, mitochondrial-like [Parasteatoda tepidariorum]